MSVTKSSQNAAILACEARTAGKGSHVGAIGARSAGDIAVGFAPLCLRRDSAGTWAGEGVLHGCEKGRSLL